MRRRLPRVLANTELMLDWSYFPSMPTRFNSSGHFSPKQLMRSTWRARISANCTPQPRTLLQSREGIEARNWLVSASRLPPKSRRLPSPLCSSRPGSRGDIGDPAGHLRAVPLGRVAACMKQRKIRALYRYGHTYPWGRGAVKVFVFDLLPYGENLEHLKHGATELPWPLEKRFFKPEVAVKTYAEHLDAWEEIDKLGYDGVGFNEHHTSPYGLMNSPNLLAASAAQRTKKLKLLIYGNLLPIHEPLRLAEELAMLDCLSNGRIIAGFARGIPREHNVYNISQSESRARFEEGWEIIRRAWTEEVFSYEGRFWTYHDVALWPRPVQQPHPPVWVPVTASKETIEWAGKHNIPITPGASSHRGVREDVIRFYASELEKHGHRITPNHLVIQADVYVADTKA